MTEDATLTLLQKQVLDAIADGGDLYALNAPKGVTKKSRARMGVVVGKLRDLGFVSPADKLTEKGRHFIAESRR